MLRVMISVRLTGSIKTELTRIILDTSSAFGLIGSKESLTKASC